MPEAGSDALAADPLTQSGGMSCDTNYKRLSQGRFPWWPAAAAGSAQQLAAHQLLVLLAAGNPTRTGTIPDWRPVGPSA